MRTLKEKFATWGSDAIDGNEAARLVNEFWETGETEGYWSEYVSAQPIRSAADSRLGVVGLLQMWYTSQQHTRSMYTFPLTLTVTDGRFSARATEAWARLSHKWYSIELGEDSKEAREVKIIMTNPRAYPAWGTKATMDIELPRGT